MIRMTCFKGSPRQIGREIGSRFNGVYMEAQKILGDCIRKSTTINPDKLKRVTGQWFESLPDRYREELLGLTESLHVPLEKLLETFVMEQCSETGCTSFVAFQNGLPWIGRNNDYYTAGIWEHITVREIPGRYGTMLFGLPGDVFSGTGMNEKQIWLHYNWLPAWDRPVGMKPRWTPFVWLREALETCSTVWEVENQLANTARDGGMALFAVDGKSGEAAFFECTCNEYCKIQVKEGFLAAANHYAFIEPPGPAGDINDSQRRQAAVQTLLKRDIDFDSMVQALVSAEVHRPEERWGTVYAVMANPVGKKIWYAADGFSGFEKGKYDDLIYPW